MNKLKLMISCICLCSLLCMTVTSCGKTAVVSANNNVNLQELTTKIASQAGKLPEMSTYSSKDADAEDWFNYLCDFDYSKVENYYISYATNGNAEEIFLIQLKDSSDIGFATIALQNRIQSRTEQFKLYLPKEVSKLSSAKIVSKDTIIALLVCPDEYSAQKAFSL